MAWTVVQTASWCCTMARCAEETQFFYCVGSYSCFAEGRWKGEATIQEHSPAPATMPMAGKVNHIGFTGTYTDEGAEFEATALVGKRSLRYHVNLRLLIAD